MKRRSINTAVRLTPELIRRLDERLDLIGSKTGYRPSRSVLIRTAVEILLAGGAALEQIKFTIPWSAPSSVSAGLDGVTP